MKIIDLLNKIANGEEVPKKVRYNNEIYDTKSSNNFALMIYEALGKMYNDNEMQLFLNDEIKIVEDKIEEEKKIPEKLPIGLKQTKDGIFNTIVKNDIQYELNEKEEIICKKIHEIIDYLKSKGDE